MSIWMMIAIYLGMIGLLVAYCKSLGKGTMETSLGLILLQATGVAFFTLQSFIMNSAIVEARYDYFAGAAYRTPSQKKTEYLSLNGMTGEWTVTIIMACIAAMLLLFTLDVHSRAKKGSGC